MWWRSSRDSQEYTQRVEADSIPGRCIFPYVFLQANISPKKRNFCSLDIRISPCYGLLCYPVMCFGNPHLSAAMTAESWIGLILSIEREHWAYNNNKVLNCPSPGLIFLRLTCAITQDTQPWWLWATELCRSSARVWLAPSCSLWPWVPSWIREKWTGMEFGTSFPHFVKLCKGWWSNAWLTRSGTSYFPMRASGEAGKEFYKKNQ